MQTVIEVKRIDLFTLFKVSFFVYAVLGLIGGFFYLFFMMLASGIGGAFIDEEFPNLGMLGGVLGIVLMPVLAFVYGAVGSVMATICGAIINLIMKATGGMKFDVTVTEVGGFVRSPAVPTPSASPPPQPPPPPPPVTQPPHAGPASPAPGGGEPEGPGQTGPQV
jgi:hypothetical protein